MCLDSDASWGCCLHHVLWAIFGTLCRPVAATLHVAQLWIFHELGVAISEVADQCLDRPFPIDNEQGNYETTSRHEKPAFERLGAPKATSFPNQWCGRNVHWTVPKLMSAAKMTTQSSRGRTSEQNVPVGVPCLLYIWNPPNISVWAIYLRVETITD